MRFLRLFPVLLFSVLLSSQIVFLSGQAFGWMCCNCTLCKWTPGCVCPGTPGYCGGYACRSFDVDHLQAKFNPIFKPENIDRLDHLTTVTECTRLSFALRILGDAGQNLRTEVYTLKRSTTYEENESQLMANSGM
jgi:hypothetical protein